MIKHRLAMLVAPLAMLAMLAGDCAALVIDAYTPFPVGQPNPNVNLINTTAPPDDPGWANLQLFRNESTGYNGTGVYLGNQWFLTAVHANPVASVRLAGDAPGEVHTFPAIPGTSVRLSTVGSGDSDLLLYRIGVDPTTGLTPEELNPAIQPITIATQLAPMNAALTMFGRGNSRFLSGSPLVDSQTNMAVSEYIYFNSNGGPISNPAQASFTGFFIASSGATWQWGENRRSSTTSTLQLKNGAGVVQSSTHAFRVTFDQSSPLENEAQGAGGDSGGPVFWKDGNEWKLVGLMHGIESASTTSQSGNLFYAFGAKTWISDLSQTSYRNQLNALLGQSNYSLMGDINLDGVVTGSIVNGVATGDLAAMASNWGFDSGDANIHSWMRGDLNQDGVTDLYDFVVLRQELGGTISVSEFAQLVSGVAIPEPSTLVLLALAAAAGLRRRR